MRLLDILFAEAKDRMLTRNQRRAAIVQHRAIKEKEYRARTQPLGMMLDFGVRNRWYAQVNCGECGRRFNRAYGYWSNVAEAWFCCKSHRNAYIKTMHSCPGCAIDEEPEHAERANNNRR